MAERIIQTGSYAFPAHFQDPWWAGFNDARAGRDYANGYATVTAQYEYQEGWLVGDSLTPTVGNS